MRRVLAFWVRDMRIARSYKLNYVLALGAGVVTLTSLFFLSRAVGDAQLFDRRYGVDYFSFSLVGVVVVGVLRALQTSFAQRLRETQVDGSIEALFGTPLTTPALVMGLALFPILSAAVGGLLLLCGGALFGAQLHIHPEALFISWVLAVFAFVPLGILSAAYTLVFKRGDPFSHALDSLSYLVSGVIYPVEVLPPFLRSVAALLPTTHAISALREAGLQGWGLAEVAPRLWALGGFALVLWPLAIFGLQRARRHVEETGTLPQA